MRGCCLCALLLSIPTWPPPVAEAETKTAETPLRQSDRSSTGVEQTEPLTLRDASRDDRWLGVSPRNVRWSPDGAAIFFQWNPTPSPEDDPDADPWFRVDRDGETVEEVSLQDSTRIPSSEVSWSRDGARGAWVSEGKLYVYDAAGRDDPRIRMVVSAKEECRDPRMGADGAAVDFMMGEDLYRWDVARGKLRQITGKHVREGEPETEAAAWLQGQQLDLFERHRRSKARREAAEDLARRRDEDTPQPIPVEKELTLEHIQMSPDGRFVTFRTRKKLEELHPTRYIDYADESGYATVHTARPKVGEPRDELRFGIVPYDPTAAPDEVEVTWVELPENKGKGGIMYGPVWSPGGDRAVVQVISRDHKSLWIAELDVESGATKILVEDHDDAWLGGPPVQANNFHPPLFEWLPGGRFVFASERTGWSHLYLVDEKGTVRALTSGEWEVRDAQLARDRSVWLIQASREHPCEDHLYVMPAEGGELRRLTIEPGRHEGLLSPDGRRIAILSSDAVHMPDLYVRGLQSGDRARRVTVSGTDAYYRHPLVQPEVVSFPHTDGRLLWASLFEPEKPNGAALLHIHGGGYRQFSHRGWTVYGYALHLGPINYWVQQGYTVLDFDYRGSAGFGRDYRTDIYRSMGMKDIDGMVTAVKYLVTERGVDPSRVGVYGISYGGFATLMALFRYPGVFAAGVADAAVTDWAHYNHGWTSRILNLPYEDEEAYKRSSPIYYAEGLADPLLLVHGIVDDNVHFQDAVRLIQRLIELEKDFEVMVYPLERHVIESEASRFDYVKRQAAFFEKHLAASRD